MFCIQYHNGNYHIFLKKRCDSVKLKGKWNFERLVSMAKILTKCYEPFDFETDGKLHYDRKKRDVYVELYSFNNSYLYKIYSKQVKKFLKGKRTILYCDRKGNNDTFDKFEGGH